MKIIYLGTPIFAAKALKAIVESGHEVVLVLTQPDRPSGRGLKLTPSPVKEYALSQNIPVLQPTSLKLNGKYAAEAQETYDIVKDIDFDIMVVAAYGLILPKSFMDLSPRGAVNIHGSLLPRWRGAAPIQRAIEAGDELTGITIMQMDEGLDTGDILLMDSVAIGHHNASTLHDELCLMGANMIVKSLENIDNLQKHKIPQPLIGANYAQKLTKEEGKLDLNEDVHILERKIRAFYSFPGASLNLNGEIVKILECEIIEGITGEKGEIVCKDKKNGLVIAGHGGGLKIKVLQKFGHKKINALDFINGYNLDHKKFV